MANEPKPCGEDWPAPYKTVYLAAKKRIAKLERKLALSEEVCDQFARDAIKLAGQLASTRADERERVIEECAMEIETANPNNKDFAALVRRLAENASNREGKPPS